MDPRYVKSFIEKNSNNPTGKWAKNKQALGWNGILNGQQTYETLSKYFLGELQTTVKRDTGGWLKGDLDEGSQMVHTSSYKISKY